MRIYNRRLAALEKAVQNASECSVIARMVRDGKFYTTNFQTPKKPLTVLTGAFLERLSRTATPPFSEHCISLCTKKQTTNFKRRFAKSNGLS